MSTIPSTDLTSDSKQAGLMNWLRELIAGLFGKSNASAPGNLIEQDEADAADADDSQYVIAPGGYRIRVPRTGDVNSCVGEMLPSVRAGLNLLPPLPHVVIDLLREIQDPRSTAASVAQIAASDPALAASLIRTVNAAAMGMSRKISSVSEAVSYLGFGAVKSMVVRLRLDQVLAPKSPAAALDAEDLWVHSLAVSYAADCLAQRVPGVDAGFAATLGLLHDIGKLAILAQFPEQLQKLQASPANVSNLSSMANEAGLFGLDHAGLGASLAAQWKLPADLVQAIRFHHFPGEAFHETDPIALRQAVYVVHVANQLVKYCYTHADQVEIDPVSEVAFSMLKVESSLPNLLDAKMRGAIGRAILFADANTKRPATSPRRFCRLLDGEQAKQTTALAVAGESRIVVDDPAIQSLFCADAVQWKFGEQNASPAHPFGAEVLHACFVSPSTEAGIEPCVKAIRVHQDAMDLPSETRAIAALLTRTLLPNLLRISSPQDEIEFAQSVSNRQLTFGIRSPALSFSRRLGDTASTEAGLRVVEADLANVLNLGWFSRIAVNSEGTAMLFDCRN